jgi:KDO2-lipid IV(A) lauroyltransferase
VKKIARIANSTGFKKNFMLKALLRIFASLPLPLIHGLGTVTGWILYFSKESFGRRTRNNLNRVKLADSKRVHRRLVNKSICETGKGLLETFAIWFRPLNLVLKLVKDCQGWEHVEAALAKKNGIIFLTPHLGCYEITSLYYAAQHPISVLYRPPRKGWLAPLIEEGRNRGLVKLAPTNLSGIRTLLRALKQGEAVGILPDQVPEPDEGEWANFFGQPAYTMTLVGKLAKSTQATVLLAFGERLPWGRGYIIHIEPLAAEPTPQNINDGIERLVRKCPEQYLWSYGRFKRP